MLLKPDTVESDGPLDRLEAFIAAGNYAPGDRLPPERELIGSLGLSRTNLRKALDALERKGEIWRHVGKGTFIASQGSGAGLTRLAELSDQVTPVHLMRARLSLEPAIAREAAVNASADAVTRLKKARDRCQQSTSWDDYEAQDDAFHRAVAQATDNPLLLALFEQLNQVRRAVAWNSVVRTSNRPSSNYCSYAEHNLVVAAIEAHDPEGARSAMIDHLRSVWKRLFGEF